MEHVQLIINVFVKLLKLEHHHNFLESCNAINVVPVGLHIKKLSSCAGMESQEIGESWKSILLAADLQLQMLLMLKYRDQFQEAENETYETVGREWCFLLVEEMEQVKDCLEPLIMRYWQREEGKWRVCT